MPFLNRRAIATETSGHDLAAQHEAHLQFMREQVATRQDAVETRLNALETEYSALVGLAEKVK